MTTVYVLQHCHLIEEDNDDVKLIGCYSTEANAFAAIARLRGKPGFVDFPDGFNVDAYKLDEDNWTKGFITLWPDAPQ